MQAVLSRNSSYEDSVRWARCLSEIVKQAGQLCNESAKAAYVEVSSRLQVSKALKEKKRKDYAFWRQFNEKPSIIPGCPARPCLCPHWQPLSGKRPASQCCHRRMQAVCPLHTCTSQNALRQPTLRVVVRAGTASVLPSRRPVLSGNAMLNVAVGQDCACYGMSP